MENALLALRRQLSPSKEPYLLVEKLAPLFTKSTNKIYPGEEWGGDGMGASSTGIYCAALTKHEKKSSRCTAIVQHS